jgi:hypothetical protein
MKAIRELAEMGWPFEIAVALCGICAIFQL